jgi:hypothetical protein
MVGWKTQAMMRRYLIVAEDDLRSAAAQVDEYTERMAAETRARLLPFEKVKA